MKYYMYAQGAICQLDGFPATGYVGSASWAENLRGKFVHVTGDSVNTPWMKLEEMPIITLWQVLVNAAGRLRNESGGSKL